MKKQTEGDIDQRRARAAEARDAGKSPSEEGVTSGASKQRQHLGNEADHEEKMAGRGRGKQQPDRSSPDPKPGSLPTARPRPTLTDAMPPKGETQRATPGELSEDDEQVFEALARLEGEREAPTANDVADEAGLSADAVLPVLQRLMDDHDIVQELPPDATGRRYRVKAR